MTRAEILARNSGRVGLGRSLTPRTNACAQVNPLQFRQLAPTAELLIKKQTNKKYIMRTCKVLQFKEKSNRIILQVTKQIFKPEEFF